MTVNKNEAGTLLPQAFTFNASNQQIRTIILDGEPYFVVKDVCDVLGHTNPSVAIQMLDDDERTKKSLGRQGEAWFVNESGLYNLIFRSNKPEAKAFRKWVTSECCQPFAERAVTSCHQSGNGNQYVIPVVGNRSRRIFSTCCGLSARAFTKGTRSPSLWNWGYRVRP